MSKASLRNKKLLTSVLFTAAIATSSSLANAASAETKPAQSAGQPVTTVPLLVAQTPVQSQPTQDSQVIRNIGVDPIFRRDARTSQNVTSVSQLSDVRPTDWAFTALQSLVERYGCIAGYPDRTYRGQRALSRYEFAAGLNACLDKINEIISAGLADKVSKEDLAAVQKLQEEFAAELATLRGRVDALEAKTTKLEAQQFSTTTKLNGEAIFAVAAGSDGSAPTDKTNTTFSYRVRLNFDTSFTGKDLLRTRLEAINVPNIGTALASGNSSRLSFEGGTPDGAFRLQRLYYRFPVGDTVTAYVAPIGVLEDVLDKLNPIENEAQATISRFGRYNPILRIASGNFRNNLTGGTGLTDASGFSVVGLNFRLGSQGKLQLAYGANNAATAFDAAKGGGVTGGSTILAAQLVWQAAPTLALGISYANSWHPDNSLNSGLNQDSIVGAGVGSATSLRANTIAGNLVWNITPKVDLGVWGSWTFADAVNVNASTTFTSWLASLSFKDVFGDGNLAAIAFGQPLYRNSVGGSAIQAQAGATLATPYHLEAFYRFRVSKNISITPGVYFVFNPDSDSRNGTATVGVIRTTFTF
ncbi:iron uptake porin [Tumidithrix elongata RA019]|uniref:Iron uptake porin n=1 Tax=Tumidithrix elongata BACA0141 TaxID=2716417 RepID=A0AAW9Q1G1_9CYAN|nr:iron uptake porin [Tumidithrix elongata RA019]